MYVLLVVETIESFGYNTLFQSIVLMVLWHIIWARDETYQKLTLEPKSLAEVLRSLALRHY